MLRDFIAIDSETANQEPSSVCSVTFRSYQTSNI